MIEEIKIESKLPIEKQFNERLKIYFMSVVQNVALPGMPKDMKIKENIGVIGYRNQDAWESAKKQFGVNEMSDIGILSLDNFKYIEDIFREVNVDEIKPITVQKILIQEINSLKPTVREFIDRLSLVANEYCEVNDKKVLISILNKIKKQKVEV